MKLISSPVEALIKPVRSVAGIVERNQSLPVVSNILIEQKGVDVTFSTTDLDIQIRTSASAKEASPSTHKSFLKSSVLFVH